MLSRLALWSVTLFWVTMSFLLWRSEFGGRNEVGGRVPVDVVWRKILTAPDNSSLDIFHHHVRTGYCRWTANSGQDQAVRKIIADELPPEPAAEGLAGYRLDLEGNLALEDIPGRIRFDVGLRLATNHVWQELNLRYSLHHKAWVVHSLASEQSVHMRTESGEEKSEQVFKFADYQEPQALLQEFDLPASFGFLGALGLPSESQKARSLSLGLTWEAWNDWITIGHTSVRVYRMQARLLDRYGIVVIVSRVGEILRVELPEGWALVNDQVANF